MARQTKPLSVKEIESAKPKEADYVLYDGDGLELLIKSSGSKIWQFRYIRPVTKKRAKKSIYEPEIIFFSAFVFHHSAAPTKNTFGSFLSPKKYAL